MLYVINDCVQFNSLEKTLEKLNSYHIAITLTNSSSLVLEKLVIAAQEVITREEIFTKAWGDKGDKISNASLNNSICEIRKALQLVGLSDIIITLPKVGFKLNATINTTEDTSSKKRSFRYLTLSNVIFITFYILLLLFFFIFFSQKSNIQSTEPQFTTFLYSENLCNFYYLGHATDIEPIKKHLKESNIPCSSYKKDIFYSAAREQNDLFSVKLTAICDKDDNNNYVKCDNILRME